MAGTKHRRHRSPVTVAIDRLAGIGPEPPATRQGQCRPQTLLGVTFANRGADRPLDSGGTQRLVDLPRAVTASLQRRRPGNCEALVVDITQACQPGDQRLDLRWSGSGPAAFSQLALKIGSQTRAGGRIAADIGDRPLLDRTLIQRAPCRSRLAPAAMPCLCHGWAEI